MKKFMLLIISIFLVIFFGCDKSNVEPDNQRNQVDIRDSIVGEYYGTGNGYTRWIDSSTEPDQAPDIRHWTDDSVRVIISKDTADGLKVQCSKLRWGVPPFYSYENLGDTLDIFTFGMKYPLPYGADINICTYNHYTNEIVIKDHLDLPGGSAEYYTITINQ